ncbi:hypothetical protein BT96DRAFT_998280 [Gymnopus androsaceus JB14]|uniref:Uncharacterized protein n=1 Tax=Gymnopus androsaceus JB14 TaxID=1447944 RepID=A0A6A4HA64_9AGAR|nr:hypothetical protein BT96DRAFT_998280 [Gymnopus androsaceus JB14]
MPERKKRCRCTRFCTSVIAHTTRYASSSSEDSDSDASNHHHAPDHITLLEDANMESPDEEANTDGSSDTPDPIPFKVDYLDESEYDASSESSENDSDMDLHLDSIDFGQKFDDTYLYIMAQANPWAAEDQNLHQFPRWLLLFGTK